MHNTVAKLGDRGHLLTSENRKVMAKADLRKAENWILLGRAVERTQQYSRLSLKEFADALERDERQVSRWMKGEERPQIDVVFAVKHFQGLLVIALAELAEDVAIATQITVTRRAV